MTLQRSTRARKERQPASIQRPAVRDLTGGTSVAIEWDVRPAFDFIFSLWVDAGSTDDLPARDRRWLADARTALPAEVQEARAAAFGSDSGMGIAAYLFERPAIRSARELVETLDAVNGREVIIELFAESLDQPGLSDWIERALAGDEAAFTEVAGRLPEWHREERLRMLRDPDGTLDRVRRVLRAWLEPFETVEARVAAMLEHDHADRAGDRETLSGVELIEKTTGGIRWLPEQGVRRVILAPSYFSRPYNILMGGNGWRGFCYPIADSALDAADPLAPRPGLVRLHRALGDETRLRILKLLADRDLYLTEIAQLLELSKPTIKHHLALLRSAGLVTVTEDVTVIYYSLRHHRLDDASTELKQFLIG